VSVDESRGPLNTGKNQNIFFLGLVSSQKRQIMDYSFVSVTLLSAREVSSLAFVIDDGLPARPCVLLIGMDATCTSFLSNR